MSIIPSRAEIKIEDNDIVIVASDGLWKLFDKNMSNFPPILNSMPVATVFDTLKAIVEEAPELDDTTILIRKVNLPSYNVSA